MSDTTITDGQENTSAQNDGKNVNQELINKGVDIGFAKGAEKAKHELLSELGVENLDDIKNVLKAQKESEDAQKSELEKLQEQLNTLTEQNNSLNSNLSATQKKAKLNEMAFKNGIEDVEYLEFKYNKASQSEGFDEATFLDGFKATGNGVTPPPTVDNSSNNNNDANDFNSQVSKVTSIEELQRIQNKL